MFRQISYSRHLQILYRADAFLIGYQNTACSLLDGMGSLVDMMLGGRELMGMLHAHVSAAQKNLVMWCLGEGKSLLGDKHMLHRYVFFQYRTGAAMCDGQFIPLQVTYPPLLFLSR